MLVAFFFTHRAVGVLQLSVSDVEKRIKTLEDSLPSLVAASVQQTLLRGGVGGGVGGGYFEDDGSEDDEDEEGLEEFAAAAAALGARSAGAEQAIPVQAASVLVHSLSPAEQKAPVDIQELPSPEQEQGAPKEIPQAPRKKGRASAAAASS